VQGTAEGAVFDRKTLDALLDLAVKGCGELARLQQDALALPAVSSPAAHR
jgi:ribonuclease PH